MGHKNQKGTVSISNYRGRVRLRWRYQVKRYSLNLSSYNRRNLLHAKKTALLIEQDMADDKFDHTLFRYNGKTENLPQQEKTMVEYFEEWVMVYKQMSCETNIDYYSLRNTLRTWGKFSEETALKKLNKEAYSPKTYNSRLSMLGGFAAWLVKQDVWTVNPFEDVNSKRVKKVTNKARKPFAEDEISKVLAAFKNDTYCPKSSRYNHSHYYPFIYFIFKTGVRNAEAIGLRVKSVNFTSKTIAITEVLARTVKGTNAATRVRKETKNGKERVLPLTEDLENLLFALCADKEEDELVFQSFTGVCIDDRMFQRRVFKPVLRALGIEDRVLYACRHTFGSRCIDAGITPVMTAFLMGNNPETALRNYTHQLNIPKELPQLTT